LVKGWMKGRPYTATLMKHLLQPIGSVGGHVVLCRTGLGGSSLGPWVKAGRVLYA